VKVGLGTSSASSLAEISDHGAGGCGLAGAEVAGKGDDIARADQQCEVGIQMRGRRSSASAK